jgi:hypothetical protein
MTYYDYPTGSDSVPDGIDFVGDPNFEAVFYDGASNAEPNIITDVGLLSPYGTAGEGGNVAEWTETAFDRINDSPAEHRGRLGGGWNDGSTLLAAWNAGIGVAPSSQGNFYGVRVVSVIPEPNTMVSIGLGLISIIGTRRRPF